MSDQKPSDTITLTIDGREVEASKGMTVLQVCDRQGIPVPRYCYHPGLSISGNCRICMVEVEGMPNTQISCNLQAQDGMVVHTQSDAARDARQHVLEFLLVNHPVDCPVCDQSGECMLQDYYMAHGRYESRLDDDKVHKRKAVVLGPHVILDSERCILCSRCVRFCDEVSESHELGIYNRADRSEIQTAPGTELANNYSACTVDICPVGALLERDFRYQMRVWYLDRSPSVCPHCSRGCNIEVHHNSSKPWKAQGRRLLRIKPRLNPEVNHWWMCDEGRFANGYVDGPDRLRRPLVRQDDAQHPSGWDSALEQVVRAFAAARDAHGDDAVAALLSPRMTVEELHLARRVLSEAMGLEHIGCSVPPAEKSEGDGLLLTADRHPNTGGAQRLEIEAGGGSEGILQRLREGELRALLVWRQDLSLAAGAEELLAGLEQLDLLAWAGVNASPMSERAHVALPLAAWVERSGSYINVDGRLQSFEAVLQPPGEALPDFEVLRRLGNAAGVAFPLESPADALRALAEDGGPLAGADLSAAAKLGEPWNCNGLEPHARTLRFSALGDERDLVERVVPGVEEGEG